MYSNSQLSQKIGSIAEKDYVTLSEDTLVGEAAKVMRDKDVLSVLGDLKYYGKKVLMRADFNVSLKNGIIGEDYRIRMTIPTIEYLTKRGAKLILMSHLGRPTHFDINYSLEPVAKRLSEIMPANNVRFAADCIGSDVQKGIDEMNMGDITLLENLRFHKEEETNDPE
jgi:phosphoglycerate kinase